MIDPIERRKKNNEFIKSKGIACFENLPVIESSEQVKLKDLDTICKKALATLHVIQIAIEAMNGHYDKAKPFFSNIIKHYGVEDYLTEEEKKVYNGNYTEKDLVNVSWKYETYWAICWALGLVPDITEANSLCDTKVAYNFIVGCRTYEDFKNKVKLRDIEEVLNMLDLYFRYDWATTEKRIKPDTPIGDLDGEVVMERRRGLEWLISNETDWNDIILNT